MAAGAEGSANSCGEAMDIALLCYSVVDFAGGGAGLNPGSLVSHVDADLPEIKHVEDEEREGGNIRETLVVMAAASDSDLQTMILSANYSRLDVGFMHGRHNEKRFRGVRGHESEVSDVRLEDV